MQKVYFHPHTCNVQSKWITYLFNFHDCLPAARQCWKTGITLRITHTANHLRREKLKYTHTHCLAVRARRKREGLLGNTEAFLLFFFAVYAAPVYTRFRIIVPYCAGPTGLLKSESGFEHYRIIVSLHILPPGVPGVGRKGFCEVRFGSVFFLPVLLSPLVEAYWWLSYVFPSSLPFGQAKAVVVTAALYPDARAYRLMERIIMEMNY